jgi:hypothetical protein
VIDALNSGAAYATATTAHVELLKESERTASIDPERLKEIENQIGIAALRRASGRSAIQLHPAAEHGQEGSRATAYRTTPHDRALFDEAPARSIGRCRSRRYKSSRSSAIYSEITPYAAKYR